MKAGAAKKSKAEGELSDEGTRSLMRAIKEKMIKQQGRVDYDKLRKEGYSEGFLAKLEKA